MNMFFSPSGRKKMLKVGDIPDPPPPAYITDDKGRPRLTDAFKDELRESVHHRHSNHDKNNKRREKKKKFGFLGGGGRTKRESSDYSQTFTWMRNAATRSSTPSQALSIQTSSKDDVDGSTQNGLLLFCHGGEEKKSDTPENLTSTTDRGSPCSIDNNQDTPQSTASRQQIKSKILTKKETEDLLRAFHDDREMVIPDSRTGHQRSKTDPPTHAPCDTGQQQKQPTPPSTAKIHIASQSATIESRPSLRKDLADEIQQSFVYRRQSNEIHKKTVVDRIMKRRDSQRELLLSDEHSPELPGESRHDDDPNMESITINGNVHRHQQQNADGSNSLLLRQENLPAYKQSVSKQKWEKLHSKLPKGKIMKKPDSIQISDETVAKTPPLPSSATDQSGQRNSLQRKMSRYKKGIQKRPNDTPTLAESGQRIEAFAPFATDGDQSRNIARYLFPGQTSFDFDIPKNAFETDGVNMQIDGDFESYKAEWARLIKTKQSLKAQLNASEMQLSVLQQQVDGLMVQTNDLKLQRDHWQGKATKLKKLHERERLKFENSTDLIAQARVELTKSMNDTRAMRTIIHDLESNLKTKDRRIEELDDTIQVRYSNTKKPIHQQGEDLFFETRTLNSDCVLIASFIYHLISSNLRNLTTWQVGWLTRNQN
jgi:predicted  nucleic acid-binding Zn-ribbon protein